MVTIQDGIIRLVTISERPQTHAQLTINVISINFD